MNSSHIVFSYAADLWKVPREGGEAVRLTSGIGIESNPYFSPDGATIAFTGEYDGNVDVYVVPAAGGSPRRLTYHPGPDRTAGWTPDGKQILFRSMRSSPSRGGRLFTIALDGTLPEEVLLPLAEEGAYSPDGTRIAYMPLARMFNTWKRYRGGTASAIWIATLADSSVEKIPRDRSNDFNPMWVGNQVYFLSDRNGPITLFCYDAGTKKVSQVAPNSGFDFKNASAGPGAIVYEQFGSIHLFDLKTKKSSEVAIHLAGDQAGVRPRFERANNRISNYAISPSGARAVFEARGEILTVPAEKGDIRNLTNTTGVAERDPSWSPDGRSIAYYSDESGEYQLHIAPQDGKGEVRKISLGAPGFYYTPTWSPDSKKLAYTDNSLNVWYLDLDKGTPVKVDTDRFDGPRRTRDLAWAPDSRWLAYTRQLSNTLRAVFVHSLESGTNLQITDGMSDANLPAFDQDGKHLYFTASTDVGLNLGWRDMSSYQRPQTRSVYALVLRKELASPVIPESDEEKAAPEKPKEKSEQPESKTPVKVSIDADGIEQRIVPLPIPPRAYVMLRAGKSGTLFLLEGFETLSGPPPGSALHKFDLKTRKTDKLLDGVGSFAVSANGEKMLFRQGERWTIASTSQAPKANEGALKLDAMEVRVDPQVEWRQIYREAWHVMRDFFYDPGLHGLDVNAAIQKYEPFLEAVSSRDDLSYLLTEAMSNFTSSHLNVVGGSRPFDPKRVPGGLLGADYKHENGRWRIARVYSGESWNPQFRAPLTQPGVNVRAGEYILAVNGAELRSTDNLYQRLEGTANKQAVLRVGPDPGGANARDVTVVPVPTDNPLRYLAWIEENRRIVDRLSGGKLAYVHLPDTSVGGYTNFNRYYFAQVGKQGVVVDERFNGGGSQADYIIDYLRRDLMAFRVARHGEDFPSPLAAIFGPKAMIINEYAGSGGDAMPFYFRKAKLGPLIGKRTWGGLVGGLGGWPVLMDGGVVTPPALGFYNPGGSWEVENFGITPDIEVELDPKTVRAGKDPQLEKAVEYLLAELKKNPPRQYKRPEFPNYSPTSGRQPAASRTATAGR
jgi:tricorn protease